MNDKVKEENKTPEVKPKVILLIGQADEMQIAAWKKMWGDVYEIQVGDHVCYVKGFDRTTMKYALSQLKMKVNTETKEVQMDMEKMLEVGEIGLQNCWIGGSEEIKTNDRLWVAAAMQVGELFELAETKLKKL
jgi:hypothetical protein